jgi:polar amino acid transport system substrate-binding protein
MKISLARALAVLVLLASMLCAGPALAAGKTLVNGIDANYPPFAYVNKSGEPSGFDVDALNWIADKMGFSVTHKPVDWDGIIPNLLAKKIDLICSGMSITEERAKMVNFSEPYWVVNNVFVAKKDSTVTVDQILSGDMKVGIQQGTSEGEWLKEHQAKEGWNFTLRYYDSAPMAVEDVLNGRLDAAYMNDAPAGDAVAKKPVKIVAAFGEHEEFGVAVRKEDQDLLKTINEGFKLLKADPYWDELVEKHLADH